jgi:microcystin-dependent protein
LSNYSLGQTGGADSVTLSLPQLAAHSHGALAFGRGGDTNSPSNADWARPATDTPYGSSTPPGVMSAAATSSAGGGQPHENRQPYLVLNYIIALQGVFPARS